VRARAAERRRKEGSASRVHWQGQVVSGGTGTCSGTGRDGRCDLEQDLASAIPLPNQPLANKKTKTKGCCSYATQPERDKGVGVVILMVRCRLVNV
jgi:hypothetical protein